MSAQTLALIVSSISPSALPLVVVILGGLYLYMKFRKIESDRIETKQHRDNDSQTLHDDVLKLKFDVSNLSGIVDLHKTKLESIDQQVSIINQELVKLNLQVEHLVETLNQQNQIMMRQLEVGKK
ncbi:MAG: hypothetical protein IIZ78_04860 [Clostridiales bacterium]|nr:hypothetical protein [Clostridiales bacterium]